MHIPATIVLPVLYLGIAVVAWLAVDWIRSAAPRLRLVDVPNLRSSHTVETPLGGGLALIVLNMAGWVGAGWLRPASMLSVHHTLVFLVASGCIAGVGLIDDLRHVPYPIRLVVQLGSSIVFVFGYAYWNVVNVPLLGTVSLGILGLVVTVVWMVGMTNAFNFMDGIDGMAGGLSASAGVGWVLLGIVTKHPVVAGLGGLLAASSLGFLLHNWHPAKIFMGDAGATFIGFTFAALPVIAARSDPRLALAGVLLVWPAIFDPGFTVIRRLKHRENIFAGHRTFLFHRLVGVGWSHPKASGFYLALPIVGALLAVTWSQGNPLLHSLVLIAGIAMCLSLWMLVRHQEGYRPSWRRARLAVLDGAQLARMGPAPELVPVEMGPMEPVGSSPHNRTLADLSGQHISQ